jgi:hypothetical protein
VERIQQSRSIMSRTSVSDYDTLYYG